MVAATNPLFAKLTVLLVEDDGFALKLAQSVLRNLGVGHVILARDGGSALAETFFGAVQATLPEGAFEQAAQLGARQTAVPRRVGLAVATVPVVGGDGALTGGGAGAFLELTAQVLIARQPEVDGCRVDAVDVALMKARRAGHDPRGAVLASDGFFPFPDGVTHAAEAGITAIVQPGGSVKDAEVIAEADRLGVAMLFTDRRVFRH